MYFFVFFVPLWLLSVLQFASQSESQESNVMSLVNVIEVTREFVRGDETIRPLDQVSLAIEEGEFVSLMGASGSGKSTLLNLVAGIDRSIRARSS